MQDGEQRAAGLQQQVAAFAASTAITAAALVNPLPAAADLVQVGAVPALPEAHQQQSRVAGNICSVWNASACYQHNAMQTCLAATVDHTCWQLLYEEVAMEVVA